MSDQLAVNTCDSNQTIDDNIEINWLLVLVEMDFSWTKLQWFDSKIDFIPKNTCKARNKYTVAYVQVAHLEHTVPSIIITMMQATDKLGKKLSIWLNKFINIMKLIRNLLPKIEKVVIWFLTRCGFYFNQNADMSLGWQLKYRCARAHSIIAISISAHSISVQLHINNHIKSSCVLNDYSFWLYCASLIYARLYTSENRLFIYGFHNNLCFLFSIFRASLFLIQNNATPNETIYS